MDATQSLLALACNPDDGSSSEEEDPMVDLVNDPAVVNTGAINESADPPLNESMDDDIEDAIPETYKDR